MDYDYLPETKKCFKCGEEKVLSEFYRHGGMSGRRLNKCKVCTRKDVSEHRAKNIDRIREYDRKRGRDKKRIKKSVERTREYRRKNPQIAAAHRAVNRKYTKIRKQPCFVCGTTNRVEAHHEDYSRKLDVLWLCSIHHKMVHHEKICLI